MHISVARHNLIKNDNLDLTNEYMYECILDSIAQEISSVTCPAGVKSINRITRTLGYHLMENQSVMFIILTFRFSPH